MQRLIVLSLLGALATLFSGCDSSIEAGDTPEFSASPDSFSFPRLAAGETRVLEITVTNPGSAPLQMADITLVDDSSAGEFRLEVDRGNGAEPPPGGVIELAPGQAESMNLIVTYSAEDEVVDSGSITLRTNDPERGNVVLPIIAGESGAEIRLTPRTVDFGQVEANQTGEQELTISNAGTGVLTVTRLSINGSADFGARLGDRDIIGDLSDDPLVLEPLASETITVTYSPPTLGPDAGELLVESNDAVEPVATVVLRANGAAACIQALPDTLDFGSALLVESLDAETFNRRSVSIESCGTTPLKVSRMEIEGADGVFRVLSEFEPAEDGTLFELAAAGPDGNFPAQLVEVGFWPTELTGYGGALLIYSNGDPSPLRIDLFGRGVDNACPIPVVRQESINVAPLDIITLDGAASTDPDGEVRRWQWTVVSRPDGSVSEPVESYENPTRPADGGPDDDDTTPQALFFVDLAGEYTLELRVIDALGQASCDPPVATLSILAIPERDMHIQMVWSTPDDPDETDDIGTDIDLHLRHQNAEGRWGQEGNNWTVYFRNTQPDWGIPGQQSDDPTLDIDDTNGAGPENINLDSPEVGVTYDIGALYFRAQSTFNDPEVDPRMDHLSYVTVRLFIRGELFAEWVDRPIQENRVLWWIASVAWCDDAPTCPEITTQDQVLTEREYVIP
ncbi:MAG: choice-of-anchor D domain-containing protein [Bradymonadia bacterium]